MAEERGERAGKPKIGAAPVMGLPYIQSQDCCIIFKSLTRALGLQGNMPCLYGLGIHFSVVAMMGGDPVLGRFKTSKDLR